MSKWKQIVSRTAGAFMLSAITTAAFAQQQIVMRIAGANAPGMVRYEATNYLAENLPKASNNRIKVETFYGTLGGEVEILQKLILGTLEGYIGTTGPMEQLTGEPITGIYDIPFLLSSWEHLNRVTQSDIGRDIEARLLKKGLRVLGYANEGTRAVYTRNAPIRSVDDLKGVKIRVMQNPTYIAMYRALGAQPVPMSWAEVYTSLQTGVIDGVDASLNAGFSDKHIELSKYVTLLGNHVVIACPIIVSERWWQTLPAELKTVVENTAKDALRHQFAKNDEFQNRMKVEWTKAGVTFTEPSREQLEKAVNSIYPAIETKVGAETIAKIRALKQ